MVARLFRVVGRVPRMVARAVARVPRMVARSLGVVAKVLLGGC